MHHCLEKVFGHRVCSGNLVEGSRMGTVGGPPCRVVGEQNSTGPVRGEKLKLYM